MEANAEAPVETTVAVTPLHRHQLAYLTPAGWHRVGERDWDATARACLTHWAAQRLPLVVTRQLRDGTDASDATNAIALGLPAPARWERRRIALRVPRRDVLYFDEFPRAEQVARLLPDAARADWRRLCAALEGIGVSARVYGSYGWQLLSGFDHVRAGSDIDLWLSVSDLGQADAVAACLQSLSSELPRLDGELMFSNGAAVAWREWLAWRAGRVKSLLVKTIAGSSLVHSSGRQRSAAFAQAA